MWIEIYSRIGSILRVSWTNKNKIIQTRACQYFTEIYSNSNFTILRIAIYSAYGHVNLILSGRPRHVRKTLSKCLKCRESCWCAITLGLFYIDHYIGFVSFLYLSVGRSTRSISNVCLSFNTITPPFGSLLRKIRRLVALTVKIAQFDNSIFNSPTYFMYMARKAIPHLQADWKSLDQKNYLDL